MKITKLLLLSLFVCSMNGHLHVEGLFDRYVNKNLEEKIANKTMLGALAFTVLRFSDEEVIEAIVPERKLTQIQVPIMGKVLDITTQNTAKYAAALTHFALSIKDEMAKNNGCLSKGAATKIVAKHAIKHFIKDETVGGWMEKLMPNLPEVVKKARENKYVEYVTNKATGYAVFNAVKWAFN